MKTMETLTQMFQNDPTIDVALIEGMEWESIGITQHEASKWDKFSDVGLFKDANLPPLKKPTEIALGEKFPIRSIKKLTLKHGVSVII